MSAKGVALDIGHLIHTQLVKVEWIYLQQVNRTILLKKEPYFRKALFRLTCEISIAMDTM